MEEAHSFANRSPDPAESLNIGQEEVLERAIGKTILLGKKVGVSPDQMILLLESGLTVAELLEYLAARNGSASESIAAGNTGAWVDSDRIGNWRCRTFK